MSALARAERALEYLCLALFAALAIAVGLRISFVIGTQRDQAMADRVVEARFLALAIEGKMLAAATGIRAAEEAGRTPDAARHGVKSWAILTNDGALLGASTADSGAAARKLAAGLEKSAPGEGRILMHVAPGGVTRGPVRAIAGIDGIRVVMILGATDMLAGLDLPFAMGLAGHDGMAVWAGPERALPRHLTFLSDGWTAPEKPLVAGEGKAWIGAAEIGIVSPGKGAHSDGLYALAAAPASGLSRDAILEAALLALMFLAPALGCWGLIDAIRRSGAAREQAQKSRELAEQKLRLGFAEAPFAAWEWRADVQRLSVNREFAKLLGMQEAATLSLHEVLVMIDPADHEALLSSLEEIEHTTVGFTLRALKSGRPVWIECRGSVVERREDSGPSRSVKIPRRIQGIGSDVSEKRESEPKLRALQERLAVAIEGFAGPFALFNAHRKLVIANRRFLMLFGGPEASDWSGASYETVALAASAHIRTENPDPEDPQARIVELADGRFFKLVDRRTADGGIVSVGVDISTQKEVEARLESNRRELGRTLQKVRLAEDRASQLAGQYEAEKLRAEEASIAKTAFLANMSHELRTPLNAVIGFSEVMANEIFGPLGNDKYRQYSKDIWESGQHLLDLISDVLDTAKVEAGKMSLNLAPIDLEEVIDSAVRITRRRADEKQIAIRISLGSVHEIEADHRLLKQMLLNLLSNAIKFTGDGGQVEVLTELHGASVHVCVRDNGVGIPAEHLPRLARPFEQVENQLSRQYRGTGLGLALTKSLVEMHGGRFQIDSELGKGTMVTLVFPVARADGTGNSVAA